MGDKCSFLDSNVHHISVLNPPQIFVHEAFGVSYLKSLASHTRCRTVIYKFTHRKMKIYTGQSVDCARKHTTCLAAVGSGVFVVVVEVDAKQEVLQVRLVASVHQFGYH